MPPSWVNRFPSQPYPIDFRFIEDLAGHPKYFISGFPELERPRQRALKDEDLRTIARDYFILQSPGETSWRKSESQKAFELQIFHSDHVKVPKDGAFDKVSASKLGADSYLNRWYMKGMTRVNVEKLLKKHFGLAIPLSHESTADHWLPGFARFNVEIEENVWEDRVMLFFDGNLQTSQQSMANRLDNYYAEFKRKTFGERYLSFWRSRWQHKEQLPAESAGKPSSGFSGGQEKVHGSPGFSDRPKLRGRKRKAALRQNLAVSSDLNLSQTTSVLGTPTLIEPKARGRFKRRERRRNRNSPKKAEKSKRTDAGDELKQENIDPGFLLDEYPSENMTNGKRWLYDNGEIGAKDRVNQVSAVLILNINQVNTHEKDHSEDGYESSDCRPPKDLGALDLNLPLIRIRPAEISDLKAHITQKYHVVSYFKELVPEDENESEDETFGFKPPTYRTSQVHVADLIDEMRFLSPPRYGEESFISVIDCNPGDLILSVASLQQSFLLDSRTASERDLFWRKFDVLTVGTSSKSNDFVDLPYSQGYGVIHGFPTLFYREDRWGYFDVDNVSRESKRPRWRASWRFELIREGGERCDCSFGHVCHDLETCRYLGRDLIDFDRPYDHYSAQDEILSDLLYYAHKPHEFLEVIEDRLHRYYPPYVPPDEENSSQEKDNDKEGAQRIEMPSKDYSLPVEMLPNEALDLVRDKELQHMSVIGEREKAAERIFEMGICHVMGLGVAKDVEQGIRTIVTAAKHGCERGQALSATLASAYGVDSYIPDKLLEKWLFGAGTRGSKVALRELKVRFPHKYDEALVVNRFTCDPRYPDIFNYHEYILPHFNLGDPGILSEQIQLVLARLRTDWQAEAGSDQAPSNRDIFAMIREPNPYHSDRPDYFVLGSLLHLAALFGFPNAVPILSDAGYDIDAHSAQPFARTPLLCALSRGHSAVAKILINRGANCEPLIMWGGNDKCYTPSPLHYLVNIDDEKEAKELAKLLVKNGADVNCKCTVEQLEWQGASGAPSLRGRSVTPLRWAVIHEKAHLVRTLLSLGAKFAYVEYLNISETIAKKDSNEKSGSHKGCLLLETPCTDPDILEMFFARARVPGLPSDFQATPLGLLISEDDGPERRLRLGFEDSEKVVDAIRLLLELQPGFEDILIWSAVRHDHIDIVKFLLEDLGWSIETRWKGLTLLHTAVLYGRVELVRYLLEEGADATAVTEARQLTCLHLIMLHPRSLRTDWDLLDIISACEIDLDAKETIDGLTALHMATRNGKFQALEYLIQLGADPNIPASDQLHLLSSGRNGYLQNVANKPMVFSESLTILGEVIIQYVQDDYYSFDYVAELIVLFLDAKTHALSEEDLTIDQENGMTLFHLLAVARDPALGGKTYQRDSYRRPFEDKTKVINHTANISLLQLVLLRFPKDLVNIKDSQGDTPLHYACASRQTHNIRTLLAWDADPSIRNKFGFNAVEILAWSRIYIGSKTFKYGVSSTPWDSNIDSIPHALSSGPLQNPLSPGDLYQAFEIFEELGHTVDPRLRQLALAWDSARMDEAESYFSPWSTENTNHLQLVPENIGNGVEIEDESDIDVQRSAAKEKKKHLVAAFAAPHRDREKAYQARAREEERQAL